MSEVVDQSARQIVVQFLDEWDTLGFEGAYGNHLHPDCVWRNTGSPDRVGMDDIMDGLAEYNRVFDRPYCKVEITNMASEGDLVFVERWEDLYSKDRDDRFRTKNLSFFRIKNGKIIEWNDYFDYVPYSDGRALPKNR